MTPETDQETPRIDAFIRRWKDVTGSEQANSQLFLTELCKALELPEPHPAGEVAADNAYVFERAIEEVEPNGNIRRRRIDLYRRGCFVLESKKVRGGEHTQSWVKTLREAFYQAEGYVRALPPDEGRPPFIVVVDIGRSIDLYAEFTRTGGNYVPYPDPRSHRIRMEDLRDPDTQALLRALWLDPDSLDRSRQAAKVTRQISAQIAELAKSLEASGEDVERTALFLMRSLFTMFAEDTGLIPEGKYTELLERLQGQPDLFPDAIRSLWDVMNRGGYEGQVMARLPQFNGGLFREIDPIALSTEQIGMLLQAARHDWTEVEPAIFGTLLERALDPRERHKLGAHYTPREYVERLVLPTVIQPLREEWTNVRVAALADYEAGRAEPAREKIRHFHYRLCETRILDPACGSGNFLYVAMEHLKRLEGEILGVLSDLSSGQTGFDTEGLTVDPHQFLGLELNPRAAAIAEMVLWIGYLQWHFRLYNRIDNLPEPILRDFHNIEYRDALIEYDATEPALDDDGNPRTIWDGTTKPHSVTGEPVPDEACREPVHYYINPRRADWPEAAFVIGNPPFIGNKRMRMALGDGYVEALREVYAGDVAESADFVMYWWHIAAEKARNGAIHRFGMITTNSLRQPFNRRLIELHMAQKPPLSLRFAIPDHPWVDSADGAAVRIAMTVGEGGTHEGVLLRSIQETPSDGEGLDIDFRRREGTIHPDLSAGPNIAGAKPLRANSGLSNRGVIPHGAGFIVSPEQARGLGYDSHPGLEHVFRPYRNGRDITQSPRGVMVIDTHGLERHELQARYPEVYQWLLDNVKPDRDENKRTSIREDWWLHAEPRKVLRRVHADLTRYIVTPQTAKHRFFTFLNGEVLPDDKLIAIGLEDPFYLGVLSSRVHVSWTLASGALLEDRPVYNKSTCFDAFPFPRTSEDHIARIRSLGERLDNHRARQQAEHPGLTLTAMYNVMEKERAGEALTDKERTTHDQGLISVLRELHDELDRAVLNAYGWDDLAESLLGFPGATTPVREKPEEQSQAEEELLKRLVDLNAQRAAEEANGRVCWLRPEFQAPEVEQGEIAADDTAWTLAATAPAASQKVIFPKTMAERVQAVRNNLADGPQTLESLADRYKRKPRKGIEDTLQALDVAGIAYEEDGVWRSR